MKTIVALVAGILIGLGASCLRPPKPVGAVNRMALSRLQIQPSAADSKPSCDATNRGTIWFTNSALGVVDIFEVCRKTALDAYGWASIAIP